MQARLSSWALLLFLLGVGFAQFTYYVHTIAHLREVSFVFMGVGIVVMLLAMVEDLKTANSSYLLSFLFVIGMMALYIFLRQALHRFDFGVGDASDYYIAGICSVTYGQDIGFFMPLSAALTGVGYSVLGLALAPWIDVIVYAFSIPLSYFIFRKLQLNMWLSFMLTLLVVIAPSSIWFAKTSFSEVPWQLFLLIFIFLAYKIMQKEHLSYLSIVTLYLLLFLAPFIRGEGALYYGLVIFLGFYHFWKYSKIQSLLWIIVGLFILSLSIQITVGFKEGYLLGWQFSRVIPNITISQLLTLLYGTSIVSLFLVATVYIFRKGFARLPMMLIGTSFAIVLKLVIAYIYAKKKDISFGDMFFLNEFGLAVGNFGIALSILIVIGLLLMHYRAIKGDTLSFIMVIMYAIFYIPFVMQAVTFSDVHAFFFYWNRYYFSIFMMIHLFALGITMHFIYALFENRIASKVVRNIMMVFLLLGISVLSLNGKLLEIMITESHQKGSYKLYPWVKEKVKEHEFSVVYDKTIRYKQNKAHLGVYHLKTLINRAFNTFKIYAKEWEPVSPEQLKSEYIPKYLGHRYVLCLSGKECHLNSDYVIAVDTIILPIQWREHYSLAKEGQNLSQEDITQSVVNSFTLHATLYKVIQGLKYNEEISLKSSGNLFEQILTEGWDILDNRSVLSLNGKGTLVFPKLEYQYNKHYRLTVRYAVIDANKKIHKKIQFLLNGKIVKENILMSHHTTMMEIDIPNALLYPKNKKIQLELMTVPKAKLMLRSVKVSIINDERK